MLLLVVMRRVVVMHKEVRLGATNNHPTHPGLQAPNALAPLTQAGAALAKGVAGLHDPQWAAVFSLSSQPFLASPSQSPRLQRKSVYGK
jgi:hypothetical protein